MLINLADLDVNSIWLWCLSLLPNYIWVLWKISCRREFSFLSPPTAPLHPTTPPPLLVICLFWEGWAWEWKQDIKWNSFQKHKQGCWKDQLPSYTASLADHNRVPQSVHLLLDRLPDSNKPQPSNDRESLQFWLVPNPQDKCSWITTSKVCPDSELKWFLSPNVWCFLMCKLEIRAFRRNLERLTSPSLKAYSTNK